MNTETLNEATTDINIELPIERGRGRPVKPKEPKRPKSPRVVKHSLFLDDYKEWYRQYYINKTLNPCVCPTCGTKYASSYSLTRHEGRSNKCRLMKLEKIISDMEHEKANLKSEAIN